MNDQWNGPLAGIGIGSNLGDRGEEIRRAMDFLRSWQPEARFSAIYESEPVGCASGTPWFLNAVALVPAVGDPAVCLERFQRYEQERGRAEVRPVNAPRPIDLDILFWGEEKRQTARLHLPHPRMAERLFVLRPLAELLPDFLLPEAGVRIEERIRQLETENREQICRKLV